MGERRHFRKLLAAYHDTVRNAVRLKNKIKAKFLQNGITCSGETVYLTEYRQKWRQQLPQAAALLVIIDSLWEQLHQIQQTEETILSEAKPQAKKYPEIKLLDEIPGLGFINAATIVAILETLHRFADKKKIWMYAGLGIDKDSSGGKIYAEKLGREYNRLLKYTAKQAALAVLKSDNVFSRAYLEMTLRKGIASHLAELTIARDILSTAWAMWKRGEQFNPEIDKNVKTDAKV